MIGRRLLHYDVLDKLGEGGAGAVYKARDRRLDRLVALKFLTRLRGTPDAGRAVLLREAKAISALSHPNIATIFDVEEVDGETFLVLEYLPGPTLRSKIDSASAAGRGLPFGDVIDCASQMAQGLAHAHRRGIVHRDVKPGNAIFSAEGLLKLTDFGLAKLLSGPQATRPGTRLGTVSYMSPEQAEGRPTDARTDVFSLGVVLYEMLAGQPPFQGEHESAVLYQIVHAAPPPLARFRPGAPPSLEAIVHRALEKEPKQRFESMEMLADALLAVGLAVESADTAPGSSRRPGSSETTVSLARSTLAEARTGSWRRRRPLLLVLLLAVVSVAAMLFWPGHRAAGVPRGSLVLLTEIENRTGQPEFQAVTGLFRGQLSQSAFLNLADEPFVQELLRQMVRPPGQRLDPQTTREIAWRGHIPLIVYGGLDQLGSSLLLSLELEAVGSQPTVPVGVWRRTFPAAGKENLFEVIRGASTWIRSTAGEAAREVAERDQPVAETTTSSWEALRLFSQAEEQKARGRDEDAILLLKEAVKVDPDFALAHMRLGDIHVMLRRYAEGYQHWQRAIAASARRPLTKREELRIKALYAMDTRDIRTAESLFRTFALRFPNDYYPHFFHGMALEWLGRTVEAIQEYQEAERLHPSRYSVPAHLAMCRFRLAQFDAAGRDIGRLRAMRQPQWADFLEGVSHFLQGNYDAAHQRFAALAQSPDPYWLSRGPGVQACLLAEMSRYDEALRVLKDGLAWDVRNGHNAGQADKLLALAWIRGRSNEPAAARAACLTAMGLESSPDRLRRAGVLLARAGFIDDAARLLARCPQDTGVVVYQAARHQVLGEIHLARGNTAQALEELGKADALDPPGYHREYLAHALESAGDPVAAFGAYQKTVESAALIWQAPEDDFPGLWAEALLHYARLAHSLGRDEAYTKAIARYVALTRNADLDRGHAAEARKLLHGTARKQHGR